MLFGNKTSQTEEKKPLLLPRYYDDVVDADFLHEEDVLGEEEYYQGFISTNSNKMKTGTSDENNKDVLSLSSNTAIVIACAVSVVILLGIWWCKRPSRDETDSEPLTTTVVSPLIAATETTKSYEEPLVASESVSPTPAATTESTLQFQFEIEKCFFRRDDENTLILRVNITSKHSSFKFNNVFLTVNSGGKVSYLFAGSESDQRNVLLEKAIAKYEFLQAEAFETLKTLPSSSTGWKLITGPDWNLIVVPAETTESTD